MSGREEEKIRLLHELELQIETKRTQGKEILESLLAEGYQPTHEPIQHWLEFFGVITTPNNNELVSVVEAAQILGYEKTGATLRRMCAAGRVPGAEKKGRLWLVPNIWVEEQKNIPPQGKGNRGVSRK